MKIEFGTLLETGGKAMLDVDRLIETRMLIQAGSGGGKSFAIRKLVEQLFGHVQIILLDIEGEFSTLREKFDFILIGEGGDRQASVSTAEVLAHRLLEHEASAIIDLYELKQQERKRFVRIFLDAMINSPKKFWHPCVVIVDEAHELDPERGFGEAESSASVNDLMSRGRKRGFAGILATQRISSLHKEAAAQARNKLVGVCSLDDDMKRGAFELGFDKKQMFSLRDLEPGEFFAYGPALSKAVQKVKVGQVQTTHYEAGKRIKTSPPPPTDKVREFLSKLEDLPEVAARELKDKQDMMAKIHEQATEIRSLKGTLARGPSIDPEKMKKTTEEAYAKGERVGFLTQEKNVKNLASVVGKLKRSLEGISKSAAAAAGIEVPQIEKREWKTQPIVPAAPPVVKSTPPPRITEFTAGGGQQLLIEGGEGSERPPKEGAMRMLKAAAQFHPEPISRVQMGTFAGFSPTSGTFSEYLSKIRKMGWVVEGSAGIQITEEGLRAAGDVDPLPTSPEELYQLWAPKFKAGVGRMLRILMDAYPEGLTRAELGERSGFSYTSGTFSEYLSKLKGNKIAVEENGTVRASKELFPE